MKILFFPKAESLPDEEAEGTDTAKFDKAVKVICYILCILEFLAMLFLPVAYLVLGMFRVFSLPFSIPDLFTRINGLDGVPIYDPYVQLGEYYIYWLYAVLYLIFFLPVLIQSIRTYQLFHTLSRFDYRENDYLDGLRESTSYTLSGYSYAILMIFFARFTGDNAILPAGVAIAVVAAICFFAIVWFRDFYTAYDAKHKTFYAGYFLKNGIKTALLFAVAIGVAYFGCKPFLAELIVDIDYVDMGMVYKGADFVRRYVLRGSKVIFGLAAILPLQKTLSYGATSCKLIVYDAESALVGKTKSADRDLKRILKGNYQGVVWWSVLFFLAEFLLSCFSATWEFSFSMEFLQDRIGTFGYIYILPVLLSVIGLCVVRIREKFCTPLWERVGTELKNNIAIGEKKNGN